MAMDKLRMSEAAAEATVVGRQTIAKPEELEPLIAVAEARAVRLLILSLVQADSVLVQADISTPLYQAHQALIHMLWAGAEQADLLARVVPTAVQADRDLSLFTLITSEAKWKWGPH